MSLIDTDFLWKAAATQADDDVATNIGGAIDMATKMVFTRIGTATTLEMLSSAAGDTTQTLTITYLTSAGVLATEVKTVNGTTPVAFTSTKATFLKAVLSAACTGVLTLRKASAGATIATLAIGETQARLPFLDQKSSTLVQKIRYDRGFIYNNHASLDLTDAQVVLQADAQGVITFALDAALDGTTTNGVGNTRLVAPAGYTFNTATKNVPGTILTHGHAIGYWLCSTLVVGKLPFDTTFTLRLQGNSA